MNCVGCDQPVRYDLIFKTCDCCGLRYEVLTYHCKDCGLKMELSSENPLKHSQKQSKRGIGRTN